MELLDALIAAGRFLVEAIVVFGIPFVCLWLMGLSRGIFGPADNRALPLYTKLCVVGGVLLGLGVLGAHAAPRYYGMETIFQTGGPWDLTALEFLRDRVNPLRLDIGAVVAKIAQGGVRGDLSVLSLGGVICVGGLALYAVLTWAPLDALRCIVSAVLYTSLVAYIVFYTVCFVAWNLNTLNFWAFLILLLWLRRPFAIARVLNN